MVTNQNLREALGISQLEAAQLLKINKSQIGMFEIGQRDLPTDKMLQLVKLYNQVEAMQKKPQPVKDLTTEAKQCIAMLEQELRNTELALGLLNKDLENHKEKYQKSAKIQDLVACLETLSEEDKPSDSLIHVLSHKANEGIKQSRLSVQLQCELQIRSLENYRKLINERLEEFKSNSDTSAF